MVPANFDQRIRDLPLPAFEDFLARLRRRFPRELDPYLPGDNAPQAKRVNGLLELIGGGDLQVRPTQAWQVFQELAPRQQHSTPVIPKGLRAFGADDAGFFLQLLPGPYRPDTGLPESIYFWKTRIEQIDPDKTFRVGLIYGPSGCGKSSLVKAGLIPQLAGHVTPVYLEATADDTEARILAQLRKRCPDLPEVSSLEAALTATPWIESGRKVVVVIDQFELYLQATPVDEQNSLADALRHCDGSRTQCVVMVRGDYRIPVDRFFPTTEHPVGKRSKLPAHRSV